MDAWLAATTGATTTSATPGVTARPSAAGPATTGSPLLHGAEELDASPHLFGIRLRPTRLAASRTRLRASGARLLSRLTARLSRSGGSRALADECRQRPAYEFGICLAERNDPCRLTRLQFWTV